VVDAVVEVELVVDDAVRRRSMTRGGVRSMKNGLMEGVHHVVAGGVHQDHVVHRGLATSGSEAVPEVLIKWRELHVDQRERGRHGVVFLKERTDGSLFNFYF